MKMKKKSVKWVKTVISIGRKVSSRIMREDGLEGGWSARIIGELRK